MKAREIADKAVENVHTILSATRDSNYLLKSIMKDASQIFIRGKISKHEMEILSSRLLAVMVLNDSDRQ